MRLGPRQVEDMRAAHTTLAGILFGSLDRETDRGGQESLRLWMKRLRKRQTVCNRLDQFGVSP